MNVIGAAEAAPPCDIGLVLHPDEARARGGPSVRVPRTVAALRALGLEAGLLVQGARPGRLAHVINLCPFVPTFAAVQALKRQGVRVVLSPILLLPGTGVREALGTAVGSALTDYDTVLVQKTLAAADLIVALSASEAAEVRRLLAGGPAGCQAVRCEVVHNPIDSLPLRQADPRPFLRHAAACWPVDLSRGFVLAVGRLEPRKNQLRLIAALADGPPLVVVGPVEDAGYAAACRAAAGPRVCFAGRIEPETGLLASAYAACRLLAHVAIAEGAPLTVLEGAAAGAPLLLSDHPAHREYCGPFARFVPALDVDAIGAAVRDLWDNPPPPGERRLQRLHVAEAHAPLAHAARLAALYADVLG